jgi:hypothetical protein
MTDINDSIYEDIKQYYQMEEQSEDLTTLEEALVKVEELEVLLVENPYQSMMHRHLSHIKYELRRQIALQTTEELGVLKDALQQDI